jgi:NTP pyrophosphatase (non-canonical NTP hydrolase)
MEFSSYQRLSKATAVYPTRSAVAYVTLGLAGESGEVADKVKKVIRDQQGIFNPDNIESIKGEMGDVLWYLAQLATELGLDLNDIAQGNLDKLRDRQARGVLGGSGDRR